jgi:hypothetical protein
MNMLEYCLWCGAEFLAKKVGANPKKFCSALCKNEFHTATRRWVERALADGRLSLNDLGAPSVSCTTVGGALEAHNKHPRG